MKLVREDRLLLLDDKQPIPRCAVRLTHRSKSSSVISFLTVLTVFMLTFFLIFRALDVLPRKINVFWISENSLSYQNFKIEFISQSNYNAHGISFQQKNSLCTDVIDIDKFDCFPEADSNEEGCINRGCCWKHVNSASLDVPLGVPYCYYPQDYIGYEIRASNGRENGMTINLSRKQKSGLPKDIQNIIVNVTYLDNDRLRIKIFDANSTRYEVPVPKIKEANGRIDANRNFLVKHDGQNLWIIRVKSGTVIFNTSLRTMIFADQMLQSSIILPSHYVYGIGENKDRLLRGTNWKKYVLFARDRPPVENLNLYGSHPFYLIMEDDGNSHGVLLFNSNPMEVVIQPTPAITFRPIGGVLDFYISLGPSPADVVSQYTYLIGRSFMPPYWSLGFHLCRLGYNSVNKTKEVWKRTRDHDIPFDTQWNDIDHMDKYNDFTINKSTYGELPDFLKELHDNDMHYIMIIDPGISNAEEPGKYAPYDDGVEMDIFIKNESGSFQVGKVWNRVSTVFPDFTNPKTLGYWTKQFEDFHKLVPFDGVWIDMNEPSNFVDGSIYGCPDESSLENPPFVPGGFEPLRSKTLCMTSRQYASVHYNVHNIHGLTELINTNLAVKSVLGKRPFIITRSTFPGSGHYGGHWDGDVYSTWDHMQWTIPSILTLNMLGISMSGADICGFNGNTTAELCARWSALGAFYPFSRNHNSDDTIEQDPVALGESVVSSARTNLNIRYEMLPFLYTLLYRSHVYGETVVRPMFFEFPNCLETYALDRQFMWGHDVMIIPALDEGQMNVSGYIPKGRWVTYNSYNRSRVDIIMSKGENQTFHTPIDYINVFIREGGIVILQKAMKTTVASRRQLFSIFAFVDESGQAEGEFYWDDGETIDSYEKGLYNLVEFSAGNSSFHSDPKTKGFLDLLDVSHVTFCGIDKKPSSVKVNGKEVPFTYVNRSLVIQERWSLLEKCLISWV